MRDRILQGIEFAVLALIVAYDIRMIAIYGTSWDNIAAYFNSLTMIGQSTYYEILREPLIQLLIAPVAVFIKNIAEAIGIVTVSLSFAFFFAIKKLARSLGISRMSAYAISLSGIVIGYMSILNATDILGAITVILALAYYYEGKYTESSILFGLSFLAKFTNLIFLFYLPFIFRGRGFLKSLGMILAINAPWFAANYMLYGNPFYGYLLANKVFSSAHTFTYSQFLSAVQSFFVLTYPFIIAFAAILIALFMTRKSPGMKKFKNGVGVRDYALLAIALVEYVYVGSAQGFVAWLGYPLYIAFLVITLKVLAGFENEHGAVLAANSAAVVAALAMISLSLIHSSMFYVGFSKQPTLWFSNNQNYPLALNYSYRLGCEDIYSNAWPYLMAYDAHVNSVFLPNIPAQSCVILFNTTKVGSEVNLTGSYGTIFSSTNFSIVRKD